MNGAGMGLILFGSHILKGEGEPEWSHRQVEKKNSSKFHTHWLWSDSQFPLWRLTPAKQRNWEQIVLPASQNTIFNPLY